MKTSRSIIFGFKMQFIAILLFAASCKEKQTTENTKLIAKVQTEATFVSTVDKMDAQYLVNAVQLNLEEILLGQLAEGRSKNNSVKSLGKMMISFHQEGLRDVNALSLKKSIKIPSFSTEKAQEKYEKLNTIKRLNVFDKTYCDMMITEHQTAINMFDKIYSESKDPDIKKWAIITLTDLRSHLDLALDCRAELKK